MSWNDYASWGYDPDIDRIITRGNEKKILLQMVDEEKPSLKPVCMERAGYFPTVVVKRYDNNPLQNYSSNTTYMPFDIEVTGDNSNFYPYKKTNMIPLIMRAADGARVYLIDYGFGLNDQAAHEGDIYFISPYGSSKTSTVSQYVYDIELQIFGMTVPRKTYAFNINCEDVTKNADYNPDHPEVYTRFNKRKGYSVMIHWPGLHFRRETDWSTYINDTYVGKWNPQWNDQNIAAYLEEEGHSPEDLMPPRIKE